MALRLQIEIEREEDGRWIAEIPAVPGAIAYGADKREAVRRAKAIALGVLSDRSYSEDFDSIEFSQAS